MSLYPQTTRLSLLLDSATTITVSDIVHDDDAGDWVRKLQFYTDPPETANRQPVLELTLRGATQAAVQIQTPQLSF